MTFRNLELEDKCDCLKGAVLDTKNFFCRKINKAKLEEKDFKTHFERGIGREENDCEKRCSSKGLSVNLFKPEFEAQIFEKYKITFNINPNRGGHCIKFKFKDGAGLVKPTPESDNRSHHDFFKADQFDFDKLEIIETVKFS